MNFVSFSVCSLSMKKAQQVIQLQLTLILKLMVRLSASLMIVHAGTHKHSRPSTPDQKVGWTFKFTMEFKAQVQCCYNSSVMVPFRYFSHSHVIHSKVSDLCGHMSMFHTQIPKPSFSQKQRKKERAKRTKSVGEQASNVAGIYVACASTYTVLLSVQWLL